MLGWRRPEIGEEAAGTRAEEFDLEQVRSESGQSGGALRVCLVARVYSESLSPLNMLPLYKLNSDL